MPCVGLIPFALYSFVGGGWSFIEFQAWCEIVLFVQLILTLCQTRPVLKHTRPLPSPNIVSLPTPFPWRCCLRYCQRQKIRHYHLILKARKESPLRYTRSPPLHDKTPQDWASPSPLDSQEEWARIRHKYLHRSIIQFDAMHGISLDAFCDSLDPLKQFRLLKTLSDPGFLSPGNSREIKSRVSAALKESRLFSSSYIASVDMNLAQEFFEPPVGLNQSKPSVYHSGSSPTPMVIDTGASVSLTPHKKDFVSGIEPTC